MLRLLLVIVTSLAAVLSVSAQVAAPVPAPDVIDLDDLLDETQQSVRGDGRAGMVWWIPVEFWQASNPADAKDFQILRDYTMVAVVVGKVSAFGSISWIAEADIRKSARLRDPSGAVHPPLETVSGDARVLGDVLRPVLRNALGAMGESIVVLFFPGRDAKGRLLIDPRMQATFAIELRDLPNIGSSVHTWNLPLTSLSLPRFCPTGKERVQASWKFCPWHGTALQ